jgi:glycine cleavage system H protein
MIFPDNLKYTKDHEWVRVEGSTGVIGVTDYAQSELGDVVFVDITDTNEIKQGEAFGTIEAVKTVSDIYAPVSGKVVEVNKAIQDSPEAINKDPYGEGWIIKIEIKDMNELSNLMDAEAYRAMVGK